ncbi:MAG: C2H2-type zinc finger protein [Candidatus Micrarchaeota archaeon]|nr:C2H2-type zinc finger protein [Candidatus Micrarchaeota archaeon]
MPRFECGICGAVFSNGDVLAAHIRSAHGAGSAPSYECEICGQRFNDEASLVSHMSGAHPR